MQSKNTVKIGDYITVFDYTRGDNFSFTLITTENKTVYSTMGYRTKNYAHTELQHGGNGSETISDISPMGKAILGRRIGDTIAITGGDGKICQYKIVAIERIQNEDNCCFQDDDNDYEETFHESESTYVPGEHSIVSKYEIGYQSERLENVTISDIVQKVERIRKYKQSIYNECLAEVEMILRDCNIADAVIEQIKAIKVE